MREQAKIKIKDLVERFRSNLDVYKKTSYNETQLRREYLDPLFDALGWDVANKAGYAEQYKDVVHEDAIKIGVSSKAPDYSFRIGGQRKFFLEAKKPSVNIKDDISPAYQLRRYAWSAKLPLSILTDFEELAIYDCRIKPNPNDNVATGRVAYHTFEQYAEKFDEIYDIISKESVLKGSFDRYIVSAKGKKGTAEVDKEFLKEIESWRDALAKNIALRNEKLSVKELNFAVQQTIDRIIFLRICEDRGIETYGRLLALQNGGNVYKRLMELFYSADKKYNSGLFDFTSDKLSHTLDIDDKVLKELISGIYYPNSPYEFSVLGADILGNVYEQFLGKVIRLTAGHAAKVEEKPEVKKAGGVYYTPDYIVDYIVKNTVGRLLGGASSSSPAGEGRACPELVEGVRGDVGQGFSPAKKRNPKGLPYESSEFGEGENRATTAVAGATVHPELVEGRTVKQSHTLTPKQISNLRILDPACGSGSFLIGAYQYLLDYHINWYRENEPEKHAKGKKSVVYKGHGGEWRLTTTEKKRILLNNIFGVDIDRQAVEVTKLSLLLKVLEGENEETLGKTFALFQERALPNLESNIKCGNSLIGPDFYEQGTLNLGHEEADRINVFDWNDDEKGFGKIMKDGGFDCVVGNPPWGAEFSVLEQGYFRILYKVAKGSNIDSYAVFIENSLNRLKTDGLLGYITPDTFLRKDDHQWVREFLLKNNHIMEMVETGPVFSKVRDTWCLVITIAKTKPETKSIILHKKLSRFIVSAEDRLSKFGGADWDIETKILQSVWQKRPKMIIGYLASKVEQQLIAKIESHPALGQLMNKYRISRGEEGSKFALEKTSNGEFSIFIPENIGRYTIDEGLRIIAEKLTPNKLKSFYKHPKIWIIRIQKMRWKQRIVCSLDDRRNSAGMKTLQVIVSLADNLNELKYLQGILASSLVNFWCVNYLADDMNQSYLEKLPIRAINFKDKKDKSLHDKMVSLVDNMLELNKKLPTARTPHERELLERRIKITDNQIDRLVYELYALTDEEIKVVEGDLHETK